METSKVVDVPRERMASPGFDSVTIVDGLSPVNGATIQSTQSFAKSMYRRSASKENTYLARTHIAQPTNSQ